MPTNYHETESFNGLNLNSAVLKNHKFVDCSFKDCTLENCQIGSCSFVGCSFNNCIIGYIIDIKTNLLKNARFSFHEVISLLNTLDIQID